MKSSSIPVVSQIRLLIPADFHLANALIQHGEREGYLLHRSTQERLQMLSNAYGAFSNSGDRLIGVCALLTQPYHLEQAGEIASLYTLSRFKGGGIGEQLIHSILQRQQRQQRQDPTALQFLFACTTRTVVADFFKRCGFHSVQQRELPEKKWFGYNRHRKQRLICLRYNLDQHHYRKMY